MRGATVILVAVAMAGSPAFAGPWIDDIGRSTDMSFSGAAPLTLTAGGHNLTNGVDAFKRACLATNFDKAAVGAAAEKLGWGFAYNVRMVPFKDPVDVGGWDAPDAALRAAPGIFFNKRPQCSLTFVPAQSPTNALLQEALVAGLGAPPSNADKAFGKNGKPNKRFEPEWKMVQADGSTHIIYARLSPTFRGAVQIAVLKRAAGK